MRRKAEWAQAGGCLLTGIFIVIGVFSLSGFLVNHLSWNSSLVSAVCWVSLLCCLGFCLYGLEQYHEYRGKVQELRDIVVDSAEKGKELCVYIKALEFENNQLKHLKRERDEEVANRAREVSINSLLE